MRSRAFCPQWSKAIHMLQRRRPQGVLRARRFGSLPAVIAQIEAAVKVAQEK